MQQAPSVADRLEALAARLHNVAFDAREARSQRQVDEYTDEVERISAEVRRAVRG